MTVTVRFYAAAREAVGAASAQVEAGSVAEICARLESMVEPERRSRVAAVLAMSALLCEDARYRAADTAGIPDGATLEVLPPFAGG